MRYSAAEYARALYEVTREQDDAAARQTVERFVTDMKARGLLAILPEVLREMPAAARAADGIEDVEIEVAHELDKETRKAAVAALGKKEDEVEVTERVNPDVIGGIRVRGRDTAVDATVRGRLERLRLAFNKPVSN
ncbi:FoF1 ATP synthase subunit delta [Patescibacteria group bacterium]